MNTYIMSISGGLITFILAMYMARNKHTRLILSISAAVGVGLTIYFFNTSFFQLRSIDFFNSPLGFTYFTSVALTITLFINDRFNYPLIHYAALFALLFFSVAATRVIFPTELYADLREGIAIEILAGGVSTFLIFITIDAFNDQDADEKHGEVTKKIAALEAKIDQLLQANSSIEVLKQKGD